MGRPERGGLVVDPQPPLPPGMKFISQFPKDLRHGPYSRVFWLYTVVAAVGMYHLWGPAMQHLETMVSAPAPSYHSGTAVLGMHALLLIFCWTTVISLLVFAGPWPFVSYTVCSFLWLTARVTLGLAGRAGWPEAARMASLMSFPMLVGATVTVSVWWLILVPMIGVVLKKDEERQSFRRFNMFPLTMAIHGFNAIAVAIDWLWTGPMRYELGAWDFFIAIAFALIYQALYQAVLDKRGWHFYIFLTPRKPWCILVYASVFAVYYFIMQSWTAVALWVHPPVPSSWWPVIF